jgi:predicted nucleic acid-binding protein
VARTKYVLDTNCFIDASRDPAAQRALAQFCHSEAPFLYLSSVVAAELRAGISDPKQARRFEGEVLAPYVRRGRVLTPSAESWQTLGATLAQLRVREGLEHSQIPRSFVFDILIAQTCREAGATLVSRNLRDLTRIARITPFSFVEPYPKRG